MNQKRAKQIRKLVGYHPSHESKYKVDYDHRGNMKTLHLTSDDKRKLYKQAKQSYYHHMKQ